MTLSNQPFANLRNLLNEKNNVQPPRHGTAVAPTPNAGIDRKAGLKMNEMMMTDAQKSIAYGSHASTDITHRDYMNPDYSVTIQHCEACGEYLGVNYPSDFCSDCTPSAEYLAAQAALDAKFDADIGLGATIDLTRNENNSEV